MPSVLPSVSPPGCRRCGVWWLALTLLYITPSPMHRAPSQLLGFLRHLCWHQAETKLCWLPGRSWCDVLFGVLCSCACSSSALKDLSRRTKPLFLPQAGWTPYKMLSPLEWRVDKLQFSFCGLWLPESTVFRPLRPAAEILLCLEIIPPGTTNNSSPLLI